MQNFNFYNLRRSVKKWVALLLVKSCFDKSALDIYLHCNEYCYISLSANQSSTYIVICKGKCVQCFGFWWKDVCSCFIHCFLNSCVKRACFINGKIVIKVITFGGIKWYFSHDLLCIKLSEQKYKNKVIAKFRSCCVLWSWTTHFLMSPCI